MKMLIRNLKWIISIVSLVLFIIIAINVHSNSVVSFDEFYYKYISLLISDRMTIFIKLTTNLGSALVLIFITSLILAIPKKKIYGTLVSINLGLIFILNLLLKILFARPRPLNINLINEIGYSFPSAHAMVSTAFYGFIIYLIWKTKLKKNQKWLYSTLLSSVILLVSLSRIYLGVHYVSDVLGGMLFSMFYLVVFTSIVSKILTKKRSSK